MKKTALLLPVALLLTSLPCAAQGPLSPPGPPAPTMKTLEQIELAEALGFDRAWIAELHFRATFSTMPSPLMLAAVAAQRTKSIRLGIAVSLLPLHHPITLAEDAATADILTGGRVIMGVGSRP